MKVVNTRNRSLYIFTTSMMLILGFAVVSCNRSAFQSSAEPLTITSNLISEIKTKTDVNLPKSCRLIVNTNYSRSGADIWLFEIGSNNQAQFPLQLDLQPSIDRQRMAKVIESMGGITIGIPKAWYFGIWQTTNAQCHATLINGTNSDYLMLERFY